MTFTALLRIPDRPEADNPAFFRVAGVPVLTRLIAGAHAAGADSIVVSGPLTGRARELLGSDRRVRAAKVHWGEPETASRWPRAVVISAPACLVVGPAVWRLLAATDSPAEVPGAPAMRREGIGGGASRPLWEADAAPFGAYAARVETRADIRVAKRVIFANVTKPTSGPISRHVNSLLSIPVSKVLCEVGVTPNQMTIFTSLLGLVSAGFIAQGTVVSLAIGGTLFQLCAALDRVDGELARSMYRASERGAWIDTIGDNLVYLAVMIGLNVGYYRFAIEQRLSYAHLIPELGVGMLLLCATLIAGMSWYLLSTGQKGTMTAVQHDLADRLEGADVGPVYRLLTALRGVGKRDAFSFIAWIITMVPLLTGSDFGIHLLVGFVDSLVVLIALYYIWGISMAARLATSPGLAGASVDSDSIAP